MDEWIAALNTSSGAARHLPLKGKAKMRTMLTFSSLGVEASVRREERRYVCIINGSKPPPYACYLLISCFVSQR